MAGKPSYRLGALQLKIMQVLWDRGPATVAQVQEALAEESAAASPTPLEEGAAAARAGEGELAYTTVATMLRKMEDRGLVRHATEGRRFIYEAAVPANAVSRSMANDMLDRLFAGSLTSMVQHLLRSREVSAEELDRLAQLIQQRKKDRK